MLSLTLATALGLVSVPARADFFIHRWDGFRAPEKNFQVSADLFYYTSDTNYDASGKTYIPTGLNSYSRIVTDFTGVYGINSRLSVFGRLSWVNSKVDSSNALAFNGSSFGLGDQSLGANYRIYQKNGGVAVDLQAQGDFAAYSNTNSNTQRTPFLGDSSTDLTGGGFITIPLSQRGGDDFLLIGGVGYTHRSGGFSAAIPWNAHAQLNPKDEGIVLDIGLNGLKSLETDNTTGNQTQVTATGTAGSGGSLITNAVNPSVINVRGEVGYQTQNDLRFTGSISRSISGTSAPQGTSFALGFTTHFGPSKDESDRSYDPAVQSPTEYGRSNKGFVNYNLEAKVLRANDRFNLVKLDKGSNDGIQVGDVFDVFMMKPDGNAGAAIARGRVTSVRSNESAIKIEEYFKEVWIEEGFIARRPIQ